MSQVRAIEDETEETTDEPTFVVQTDGFAGPLDLLLRLVKERKLHISDITLSAVADDYIGYVQEHSPELDDLTSFIETATTLMLIKSKALLPEMDLSDEEAESIADLEDRLKAYQNIKELESFIQELFGTTPLFFHQPASGTDQSDLFAPGGNCTTDDLRLAVDRVTDALPEFNSDRAAVKKTVRLEDVTRQMQRRVQKALSVSFRDMHAGDAEKSSIILSFLALLELIKLGEIEARQDDHFTDITLESKDPGVPQY